MNWEERLAGWVGKPIEVRIEDQAGEDPIAPPKSFILDKVLLTEDHKHLQIYLNAAQFIAIPLIDEENTKLIPSEQGAILQSSDRAAQLVYKIIFQK
jgi:hypothetical protein